MAVKRVIYAALAGGACAGLAALAIPVANTVAAAPVLAPATTVLAAATPASDLVSLSNGEHRIGTVTASPPTLAQCEAAYDIACYGARQVEAAYHLPSLYNKGIDGKGETIAIVDCFGSPTIGHDLAVFDKAYGLPAPPSLTVIQPAGPVDYKNNADDEGWAGETTLDVEYAHAVAPGASILLVETPVSENEGTSGFPEIVAAENYVINHKLATVISQSFSATEQTFPTTQSLLDLRSAYVNAAAKGVTVLTAAGDSGAADTNKAGAYYLTPVTSWPDSDPLVTGIGGTELHLDAEGQHTSADTVWNDTFNSDVTGSTVPVPYAGGGGKSVVFSRPFYQNSVKSVVGVHRGVPDISMSGACNGAVNTYQSFPDGPYVPGWYGVCGTSEATPLFAGIVALADQVAGHGLGLINPALYRMSAASLPGIVGVTGTNTVAFEQGGTLHTVKGGTSTGGYSTAAGLGTVDAQFFVPELADYASKYTS